MELDQTSALFPADPAAGILGQRRQTLDNRVFGCLAGIAKIAKTAAAKFPTPGMSKSVRMEITINLYTRSQW